MEHYYSEPTKPLKRHTLLWITFVLCTLISAYLGDHDQLPYCFAFGIFAFVSLIAAVMFTIADHEPKL